MKRQRPPRDWLSSATISRPESTGAICSAVSCTSTGELHERLYVPHTQQPLVSSAIRGIFTATSAAQARARLGRVVEQLRPHAPKVAALLEDAEAELLAFSAFPAEHWPSCAAPTPWSGPDCEIGRRSDVVGIFLGRRRPAAPGRDVPHRANDEWLVGRRYLSETSMALVLAAGHPDPSDTPGTQEVAQLTAS